MLRGFFDEGEVQELREAMGGLLQKAVPEQLPDVGVDRWLGAEGQALRHSLGVTDPEPDAYNPARVTYIDMFATVVARGLHASVSTAPRRPNEDRTRRCRYQYLMTMIYAVPCIILCVTIRLDLRLLKSQVAPVST